MPRIESIQLPSGASNGKVLTSDASGNATWQDATGGGGTFTPVEPNHARYTLTVTGTAATWTSPMTPGKINGSGDAAAFSISGTNIVVRDAGTYHVSVQTGPPSNTTRHLHKWQINGVAALQTDTATVTATVGTNLPSRESSLDVVLAAGDAIDVLAWASLAGTISGSLSITRLIQGSPGPKGDLGGTMGAASYTQTGTTTAAVTAAWKTLALTGGTTVIDPPGSVVVNADSSISVAEAGWYLLSGSVHGAWGTAAVLLISISSSPNAEGIGSQALGAAAGGPRGMATALMKLTPSDKIYLTGYSTVSMTLAINQFSCTRVGGPQGPKGDSVYSGTTAPSPRGENVLWIDTDETPSVYTPPQIVTTLPASPVDGMEVYYQASYGAQHVEWHLRYRATSPYSLKWDFLGGAPMTAEVLTSEAMLSASWMDPATVGPSIVAPLAMDYDYAVEMRLTNTHATISGFGHIGLSNMRIAAAPSADADNYVLAMNSTIGGGSGGVSGRKACLAGDELRVRYAGFTSGTLPLACSNRKLRVTPVRVG